MISMALDLIQLAGLLAILIGVALTLPLGLTLIVDGALILGAAIMIERQAD